MSHRRRLGGSSSGTAEASSGLSSGRCARAGCLRCVRPGLRLAACLSAMLTRGLFLWRRRIQPPASYFPPDASTSTPRPATPTPAAPVTPARSTASTSSTRGQPPSLIARMGLQNKVVADDKGKGKEVESGQGGGGWSPNAAERERNLRARKEKLVLEARRCVCVSLLPRTPEPCAFERLLICCRVYRKLLEKEQRRKEEAARQQASSSE